ncbi:MAG: beta-propeller domain-containing protein [Bacilli bacterium]|nr:beta-propeller domain-containing protein [Bacilli bacterium]MBN2697064.1 beta-propeller domain-containing protein [Bacilli bacterium]
MKKIVIFALILLGAIGLIGCDQRYEPLDYKSIDEVGSFKNYAQLKDYLDSFYEDQEQYYYGGNLESDMASTAAMTTTVANAAMDGSEDRSYSETNNQVDGVFESDRILTDGYYIYVLADNRFVIIDADNLTIVDSYEHEEGYLYGMYKYNDRIVLLANEYHYWYETEPVSDKSEDDGYLFDYYYVRYSFGTRVMVFDTTIKTDIELEKEMYFEGSYLTDSRMIDGHVYLVLNNYAASYGYDDTTYIPQYYDSTVDDEIIQLPASDIYYMPNDYNSFGYLLLVSFAVEGDEAANVKGYLGSTYQIFMSLDNLYTIVYRYWYDEAVSFYRNETLIIRYEIEDHELVYKATGSVDGSPLNQFSMDEHDGYFRIATTGYSYTEDSWEISNKVTIFDATTEGVIEPVSVLEGLGKPNERIYAVRFSGDVAYVVTFVNTDPLYKLDLSDPENPEILGELYEEGVSDYLHEISDDLLLGVGRQAETVNEFTNFTGVKIALYDVSGNDPLAIETYFVEGEYSYTPVIYDHKAFVSYEPDEADFLYVAIPVYEYNDYYWRSSQSVFVFKVHYSGDLEYLTKLTHMQEQPASDEYYYWYWDSIERTIMIENRIYTVSYNQIQMYDMDSDFAFLGKLEFSIPVSDEPVDDETTTTSGAYNPDETITTQVGDDSDN